MKLTRTEIQIMAEKIIGHLLEQEIIVVDDKDAAVQSFNDVILADLTVEDRLNEEVRSILEQHSGEVDKSGVEFYHLFKMLKSKLIRERNLIL